MTIPSEGVTTSPRTAQAKITRAARQVRSESYAAAAIAAAAALETMVTQEANNDVSETTGMFGSWTSEVRVNAWVSPLSCFSPEK